MLQAGAGLTTLAATAADAAGADGMAKSMYQTGAGLRARGNAAAPEINSISQVKPMEEGGFDRTLRYGVGTIAQGAPMIGAGLAGAALTRGKMAPMIGGTLAATPFAAGDLAVRQQEDPVIAQQSAGLRLGHALGGGAATAALGMAVPTYMGGKLFGAGVGQAGMGLGRNIASNVGEAVVGNAVAGVAGEKVNQMSLTELNANRDTSMDKQAMIDAGAGGAVSGVPFAGAGIVGQALHGKTPVPRTDGQALPGEAAPAPGAKPSLVERMKGAFKKDDVALDREAAKTISENGDVVDVDALSKADPVTQGQMLKDADESRVSKVTDWAKKMYEDADLTPEARASIDDFMANPADRAAQAGVAGMKMARDASETVATKAKEFGDMASAKFDEFTAKGTAKDSPIDIDGMGAKVKGFYESMTSKAGDVIKGKTLSEQFSPKLHNEMADTIAPALAEKFPALVQNDKHMQVVTGSLRKLMAVMQATGKLDADTAEQLHGWFGDDAPSVMAALHKTVLDGADTGATEKYFGALNQMTDDMVGARSIEGQVKAAWPEGDAPTPQMIKETVRGLREHMDGSDLQGRPKAEVDFRTKEIEDTLRAQFGDKAKGLIKAFEKDAERRNKATKESMVEDTNTDMTEQNAADVSEVEYLGGGKDKAAPELVRSPEAHRAEFDSKSAAERLIEKAQADNPDRMVSFVKVKDLPDDVRAKHPNAGPDDGLVLIEGTRDETRMSPDEIKKVTIDTHAKTSHAANNASRIDTGVRGAVLDARALVKTMKRKLDYTSSDDHGNRNRTARAFMEGIAAVQDHLGAKFEIPDSTVLETGFTYGDAKKLTMRKPDPAWMKGKTDEETNKSLNRNESMKEMSDRELEKATVKTQDILEKREAAFAAKVTELRESGTKVTKEAYRELRKQMGVDDAKEALRAAERETEKRTETTHKTKTLEDEGRSEVSPTENISRVGDGAERKVGFDDNPLAYDNFVHGKNVEGVARGLISNKFVKMEGMKTSDGKKNMIAAKVAEKGRALLGIMDKMKEGDKALMTSIARDGKVSSISEVVNELTKKYAAELNPPEPPKTTPPGKPPRKLAPWEVKHAAREAKLEAQIATAKENAAAKKPSAFTERVLGEGDLAPVIKSIKASDDPVALRRAVDALQNRMDNPRAREVFDAANERITALIEQNPDLGYDMQRKSAAEPDAASKARAMLKDYQEFRVSADQKKHASFEESADFENARDFMSEKEALAQFPKEVRARLEYMLEHAAGIKTRLDAMQAYVDANRDALARHPDAMKNFVETVKAAAEARKEGKASATALHADLMQQMFKHRGDATWRDAQVASKERRLAEYLARKNLPKDTTDLIAHEIKLLRENDLQGMIDSAAKYVEAHKFNETIWPAPKLDTKFSNQKTNPGVTHTGKVHAEVEAHIKSVLGGRVDVEFTKMLHAGEFLRDGARAYAGMNEDVIRVSVHALDPMGTAMHESMHAMFRKMRDGGLMDAAHPLMKAADSFAVKAQLQKLLAGEPEALKQLGNLEERAAYMYQFWAAGKLQLAAKPTTILGHIKAMIHKVMGMWTNDERAVHIMEYFQSGEYGKNIGDPGAVRRALMQGTNEYVESFKKLAAPLSRLADATFATGNGRLRDTMIPALMELADKVYAPLQGEGDDAGYVPAARVKQDQTMNKLADSLSRFDEATITDALKSLQQGLKKGASGKESAAMLEVRAALKDMHTYMTDAGVKMGDLGPDYFPRVWDADTIIGKDAEFRAMLEQYRVKGDWSGNTDQLITTLTRNDGTDMQIETVKPGMTNTKQRKLDFISALDAEPFMQKNLFHTMNSYVTQATRRAEWARRFNDDGSGLHELLERAKDEGAAPEDIQLAGSYLKGVDGTLGDTIDPKLRRAFGSMIVYQNLRVLPLMIFSSLIDPMGIMVRGGTAHESFNAFKRGIAEIPKGFKKDAKNDAWADLAATMGVIENSVLMRTVGTSYAQGMSGGAGRKINDVFFKYNLMAQYNNSMRVGATEAAVSFLGRHADGTESAHSKRWLAELGFVPGDIVVKNGRPLLTASEFEAHGMNTKDAQAAADRMALAVNKWVDGAVLRPNSAHKPIWMNDPRFILFSHLKQFVYSFQETILKRVLNEGRHGNIGPAYALAAYVPFMIAADAMKGLVIGGGSQPDYKEGWDLSDYVGAGVQRAGLLGVGQIGLDVKTNLDRGGWGVGAVVGPTVEQLGDVAQTVGGSRQFKTTAMDALPANQLFDAAGEALETPKM